MPGFVPPPGMGQNPAMGNVPPPPGYAPPVAAAPEPAPPPDLRRDPFAAQQAAVAANLAAFYGGGALPGDAAAVKDAAMGKPKPWALIGGGVAVALVMFGVGHGCGSIAVSRNAYNETTDQAVRVRDEVEKIQKKVAEVGQIMGPFVKTLRNDREAPDIASIKKLEAVDFKEPEITRNVFHTNYASFDPPVVQGLFEYYNGVTVLARQVNDHATKTLKDREALDKYAKSAATRDKTLGVILDYSQAVPQATLVDIGGVLCPDPNKTDCPAAEAKLRFRTSLGGEYQARPVKGPNAQALVFAIGPTELQKSMLASDPNALAYKDYVRRTAAILESLGRTTATEKPLVEGLKKRAGEAKLFTLF